MRGRSLLDTKLGTHTATTQVLAGRSRWAVGGGRAGRDGLHEIIHAVPLALDIGQVSTRAATARITIIVAGAGDGATPVAEAHLASWAGRALHGSSAVVAPGPTASGAGGAS